MEISLYRDKKGVWEDILSVAAKYIKFFFTDQ